MCNLELYYLPHSSPCRAVLFTASALGLKMNLRNVAVDEENDEILQLDELCKINPNCSLPTLVDNDMVLWESHAIQQYLVTRYSRPLINDHLYPNGTELQRRSSIDSFMFYDLGAVYKVIMDIIRFYRFEKVKPPENTTIRLHRMLHQLERIHLAYSPFLNGNKPTVADMAIVASLTFLEVIDFNFEPWTKVFTYVNRCKQEKWYQAGQEEWNCVVTKWRKELKESNLI